ncbi:MAG: hypothetical protein ACEQSF_00330 [Solirubrobacteraceae bacterium]
MEEFTFKKEKSLFFKFSIFIQLLLMFFLFVDGYQLYPSKKELATAEIFISIIGFLSVLAIYFFKKIGVYFYAIVLLTVAIINPIKSDIVFTIFFFIGVALPIIITRWRLFK